MHQRMRLNLPSSKPSGVLVEALSFGLGIAELVLVRGLAVLFVHGLSFVHTVVYDAYKQAHNQETDNKRFIVELESGIIMEFGVIFLGGFLMAWTTLCHERRGKVLGRSEVVWRMK